MINLVTLYHPIFTCFRYFDIALPQHLFEALQGVALSTGAIAQYGSDFSVIDYYKSWTEVGGHPVLNVVVDHTTGSMTITQVYIIICFYIYYIAL